MCELLSTTNAASVFAVAPPLVPFVIWVTPPDVMRSLSFVAVANLKLLSLWIYSNLPSYSPVPEVASEKYILPPLEVPERIVIPVSPDDETVKLSALACPSVVVPSNNPVDVNRAYSELPS